MSEHLSYVPLDSVVNDYLIESNKSVSDYFRIWHLAFRGLEDLGIDFFYYIKSVKLPINSNMTVTLPDDYINWTKVGVLNKSGEIIPLYYNDKLTTYADIWPNRTTVTQDNTLLACGAWGVGTWFNYWNGYSYTNIYGVPSGAPFVGDFKVDAVNGVILLNEKFKYDYLMIEYVSSPKEGNDYYLPMQFREALIAWMRWRDIISIPAKTHMENSNVGMRRHEYYNERRIAMNRWKPIRIYEQYQASQEQTRIAIKS